MTQRIFAGMVLLLLSLVDARTGEKEAGSSVPFSIARVTLEQNATDRDFEVVFEAKGGSEGLTKLTVVSPNGRTVVDFTAPDAPTLGMRQFRFESPDSKDLKSLKSAYPEGMYTFDGTTTAGVRLHGKSTLSHTLPAVSSFVQPKASARNVSVKDQVIGWMPVKNATAYIVYIEQDELDVSITTKLPGTASTFVVPNGFLRSATEYTLGIGTVTGGGNASFIETTFVTSEKK